MSIPWARIMAPVAGTNGDGAVIAAAAALAAPFEAEVAAVYAPADVADLMPWMGDGFMGGVQVTAVQSQAAPQATRDGEGRKKGRAHSAEEQQPNHNEDEQHGHEEDPPENPYQRHQGRVEPSHG
jgi:hypothetical protein